MSSALNWFEIPSSDLERATAFYGTVLGADMSISQFGDMRMAMFPVEEGGVGGAVVHQENMTPASQGTMVYLNGGADLAGPLSRVADAGGQVVLEKTAIGEHGFIGIFMDTEGNAVGLHSMG